MAPRPDPDFQFYECTLDGQVAFITVDLNLHESAPQKSRPLVARITIPLLHPRDNGLPVREESSKIYDLDDALDEALWKHCGALQAGKYFSAGARKIYFYAKSDEGLEEAVNAALSNAHPHVWEVDCWEDPEWEVYLQMLYPNPLAMQYIQDQRVVAVLEREGDPLTQAREVTHWAYFSSENSRDQFLEQILPKGFQITAREKGESDDRPWMAVFSRVDEVKLGSITRITEQLWILADTLGGEYDGWECQVMKKPLA